MESGHSGFTFGGLFDLQSLHHVSFEGCAELDDLAELVLGGQFLNNKSVMGKLVDNS